MKHGWMFTVPAIICLLVFAVPVTAEEADTSLKVFENITSLDQMSEKEGEATVWYSAKISFAGAMNNGRVRVRLTDNAATPAFVRVYFEAPTGQENKMLATALSALALTNGNVYVGLPSTTQYAKIVGIYVAAQ